MAPYISKRRQKCPRGSGLFSSGRRRGDLWKSLGEASDRRPQGAIGGGDGGVGVETQSTRGSEPPIRKNGGNPVKGPWRGVGETRRNLRTGSSKGQRAATFIGFVPVASDQGFAMAGRDGRVVPKGAARRDPGRPKGQAGGRRRIGNDSSARVSSAEGAHKRNRGRLRMFFVVVTPRRRRSCGNVGRTLETVILDRWYPEVWCCEVRVL